MFQGSLHQPQRSKVAVGQMTSTSDREANYIICQQLAQVRSSRRQRSIYSTPLLYTMRNKARNHAHFLRQLLRHVCSGLHPIAHAVSLPSLLHNCVQAAVAEGCSMLFLPECFSFIGGSPAEVNEGTMSFFPILFAWAMLHEVLHGTNKLIRSDLRDLTYACMCVCICQPFACAPAASGRCRFSGGKLVLGTSTGCSVDVSTSCTCLSMIRRFLTHLHVNVVASAINLSINLNVPHKTLMRSQRSLLTVSLVTLQSTAAASPLEGPIMQRYLKLAQSNRLWLSLGGFQEHCSTDPQRLQNCHVIVDDTGQIVSTYRKVHLFDVEVFNGPVLKETTCTVPGKQVHSTCLDSILATQ